MKKIFKLLTFIITFMVGVNLVNAASFTISAGSTNITKGGSTKLTIKGTDVTGRFNITTSNSSVVSVSEAGVWIENNSYSITLSALNVGTSTITVTPVRPSDSSGNQANLASKTIKITVSLPREKSTDNNLKSLSVEGYEITPSFDKNIQNYSVVVPEGTKSVKVNALVNESHASLTGTGDIEVSDGINSLNVIVTSETGVEKTYTITVEVKDSNPIYVNVLGNTYTLVKLAENLTKPEYFEEKNIKVNDYEIPAFYNATTNLTLVGLKDEAGIISNFIYDETSDTYTKYNELSLSGLVIYPLVTDKVLDNFDFGELLIGNTTVKVFYRNSDSRYVMFYGINIATGEEGFYTYDKKSNTAIIFDEETNILLNDALAKVNLYSYIIIGFACLLVIMFILLLKKNSKKNKSKEKKQKAVIFDDKELEEDFKSIINNEENKEYKNNEIIESKELEDQVTEIEKNYDNVIEKELNNVDNPKKRNKKKKK